MSEPEATRRGESTDAKLFTLSEISQRTGISMPTLQRYKKTYQERIPSVGVGRKQRYPESALPVFGELKNENAGKRGRPRKDASAPAKPAKAKTATPRRAKSEAPARGRRSTGRPPGRPRKAAPLRGAAARRAAAPTRRAAAPARGQRASGLLTLTQISKTTGISYPTLVRYVRLYEKQLPHEGTGRSRRFYPQAVEVFRSLRQESGRGGRKKGSANAAPVRGKRGAAAAYRGNDEGLGRQFRALEKSYQALEKRFEGLVKNLKNLFR